MGRDGFFEGAVVVFGFEVGEKFPAGAVTGEVIQAEVGGNGLEPAAGGGVAVEGGEMFVGLEEHRLHDVLRIGIAGQKPDGHRIDHVLVVPHELFKVYRFVHFSRAPPYPEHDSFRTQKGSGQLQDNSVWRRGSAYAVTFRTNPDKSGQNPTPLRGTLLIINDFQPDILKVSGWSPKEDLFIFSLRIGRN